MSRAKAAPLWKRVHAGILGLLAAFGVVLGAIFNLDALANLVTDRGQKRDVYQDLLVTIERQIGDGTYELAFQSAEQAVAQRLAGGWKLRGLASIDDLEAKQADAAMAWLRDARVSPGDGGFSALVTRVQPALQREVGKTHGARRADLIAHLGYADFLRMRDGRGGLDPEKRYREALELDSANPFANAMLGHWQLSRGKGQRAAAEQAFAAALASGRERAFVRTFELAAYTNSRDDAAFLRVLGDMQGQHEAIDDGSLQHASAIYFFGVAEPDPLLRAMPARTHLELVRWLRGRMPEEKVADLDYFAALLEASAGDVAAAREQLGALLARLRRDASSTRTPLVEAALLRLRPAQPAAADDR